jgi:photosystem II stability/assembly factor-like uncharacterized protein
MWLILLMPIFQSHAQSYLQMIEEGQNVYAIIDSANAYFANSDKGRGTGYNPYKRWEYMALRLMNEEGELSSQDRLIAEWERFQAEQQTGSSFRSSDYWQELGPDYYNATSGWNPGVGRLTGFTVDPTDYNHIIVGAVSGGVWRTRDGGELWEPLCDFFSNMAVYSTAMHPNNKNTYYFGSSGGRIYKSTDAGATWEQLGSAGSSLINKLLIHPEQPDLMFASSQSSGLYRSQNGGLNWVKITSDGAGYDLFFKPGDLNTIYASGTGFHISNDGGISFRTLSGNDILNVTAPSSIAGNYPASQNSFTAGQIPIPDQSNAIRGRLVLYEDLDSDMSNGCGLPINAQEIEGNIVMIWRGGCTFTQKVLNAQKAGASAVIIANNLAGNLSLGGGNDSIQIVTLAVTQQVAQLLESTISEQEVFIEIASVTSDQFSTGPKMIGVSNANPEIVYVLEASGSRFGALYKSEDSGRSFQKLEQSNRNYFGYSTVADDDRGQAPRDMAIAVNPRDADEVHIAGILTWVSFNGGNTFRATSDWIPNNAISKRIGYCHADVDILEFMDTILYVGTDGGLFRAKNTKNIDAFYYEDLTTGLGIRQFYRIGISQTAPVKVSGGSQDNGTSLYTTQFGWLDWLGADGMECFIDKNNANILYGTSQNGRMYVSTDGGFSQRGLPRPGSGDGNWVTPFEQDPIISDRIYVGYEQVFQTDNRGQNWEPISIDFGRKLDHFKIAPNNRNIMFAAHTNQLFKTSNAGQSWESLANRGYQGNITEIAIHPRDPNKVAITTNAAQKVFVSEDGGQTWLSYRLNLPDFSALSLVWHDSPLNGLYLGMNYGIYYIDDNMDQWLLFNNQLPNVIVNELEINYVENKLYAATYGRGLWVSNLYDIAANTSNQQELSRLYVFPNPVLSEFTVHWEGCETMDTELTLFDLQGRPSVYIRQMQPDRKQIHLDGLLPGTYFLRLANEKGTLTRKVQVAH